MKLTPTEELIQGFSKRRRREAAKERLGDIFMPFIIFVGCIALLPVIVRDVMRIQAAVPGLPKEKR